MYVVVSCYKKFIT